MDDWLDPRAIWREYRGYVAFSTGLFLVGALLGAALGVAGVDLAGALTGGGDIQDALPNIGELSQVEVFLVILLNNTRALLLFVLGAGTLGAFTVIGLLFNGLLIGFVVVTAAASQGVSFVVVGIVPHGIIELPALIVGAAVGFRLTIRTLLRLAGPLPSSPVVPDRLPDARDSVMSTPEWRRTGVVVVGCLLGLLLAAFVEAFVTATLLEAFFGG